MSRLKRLLSTLKAEERLLTTQLGKVRDALAALGDVPTDYRARRRVRAAKKVVKKARRMSAQQRAAVSKRMKAYWAKRRKAKATAK